MSTGVLRITIDRARGGNVSTMEIPGVLLDRATGTTTGTTGTVCVQFELFNNLVTCLPAGRFINLIDYKPLLLAGVFILQAYLLPLIQ